MEKMTVPVKGRISCGFGNRIHPISKKKQFHNGVDIAAPLGTDVHAPADGKVNMVWDDTIYGGGLSIRIKHYNGYTTGYAHLSKQLVKVDQVVRAGDVIAKVGSTGSSTGPHLHFALRNAKGEPVDPAKEIQF